MCVCGLCEDKLVCLKCWGMSLEDDHCGHCQEDPCICGGGQQYSEEVFGEEPNLYVARVEKKTPNLKRSQKRLFIDMVEDEDHPQVTTSAAGKRPAHLSQMIEEIGGEDSGEVETPDLQEYFSRFDLDPHQIISMCRTFASSIAARLRASKHLERKNKD